MKMDDASVLAPTPPAILAAAGLSDLAPAAPTGPMASPEVVKKIGEITRLLHDTLEQLGVMPKLQTCTVGLPDAKSRLTYIASKTAAAAEKVLTSVDEAKAEQSRIATASRELAQRLADPVESANAITGFAEFCADVEARTAATDAHLTDIMLAQDFHDLTGQVVAKVVTLANDLEDSLLKLLIQVVPPERLEKVDVATLNGPVVDGQRLDVVHDQGEVDDLLASLGF